MFCIAAFIVFAILAIFSASFRPLAAKAWHCVLRRVTFRPCDISFGQEMKGKLVGKLVFTHPRLARFLNRWIDWISFAFVILSIWSLLYVANAGLNLWVYDTCDPRSAESCSLSGEACSIDQASLGLFQAVDENRIGEWAAGPFVRFAETISRIPDRLKTWEAKEYLGPIATYYRPLDESKPYALEVIDPGCKFCKKLTGNMKEAGAMEAVNVSYLLYPIKKSGTGGYKFPHSPLMASYVEATKRVPLTQGDTFVAGDWQLLGKIFAEPEGNDVDLQTKFNIGMTKTDAERMLKTLLQEIGYSASEIERIAALAVSAEVQESLDAQRVIVEERIRTIKIPTLLFGGRRFDRVISPEKLKGLMK
jgi:hypothetical protein